MGPMPPGLLQGPFTHANWIACSPSRCRSLQHRLRAVLYTKVNLVCQSSSSGEDPPHSPAFPPTKEDVEFVKRYILGGRAIAFRRAQDAARPGWHGQAGRCSHCQTQQPR